MARLDLETEKALDTVRDRYGRTVRFTDAADIRTRRTHKALAGYRHDLGASALPLLSAATQALDRMQPSAAVQAWHELIASLATSHGEILCASTTPSEREASAVWVHLAHWADTGPIAAHLADLHHEPAPEFTADESRKWTERAQRARSRGALDLFESWYAADGRRITLAYLVEDDDSDVVALAGDPDAPGWAVIGRYDTELDAGTALPRPMPRGFCAPTQPPGSTAPTWHRKCPCRSFSGTSPKLTRRATPPTRCSWRRSAVTSRGHGVSAAARPTRRRVLLGAGVGAGAAHRFRLDSLGGSSASWPTKSATPPPISARPWPSCLHTAYRYPHERGQGPPSPPRPPRHVPRTPQRTRAAPSPRSQKALSP